MPYRSLVRDKDAILSAITVDGSGQMIAKEDLKIVIPVRYEEADFADVQGDVYTLAIFAIIKDGKYAVNNVPSRVRLTPVEINKVKYNEEDFYELSFEKGSVITENINLVMDDTIGYYIYNYFISFGKMPWYLDQEDALAILDGCREYAFGGSRDYGDGPIIYEMIISMCMRDANDVNEYWRQTLSDDQKESDAKPFEFIPLRNVSLGARNTTAKLMGSYFDEGLNSALLYPSSTTERVEQLLRQ